MKRLIVLLSLVCATHLYAQNIDWIEYFIDTDPGFDKATQVAFTPAVDVDVNFTIDINSVKSGFHIVGIRARDETRTWSLTCTKPFFKGAVSDVRNITYAEYFIDTNPGYSKGTAIPITSGGSFDSNFAVDLGNVKSGFHVLYISVSDESGVWGLTHSNPFFKGAVTDERNITYAEYFIDTDPGYSKGTAIPITSGGSVDSNFAVDLGNVKSGFHVLYTRVADESGIRGLTHSQPFFKGAVTDERNVTYAEYFIDTDPGYGKGTAIPITSGGSVDNNFIVNLGNVKSGFHVLYTRVADESGIRGLTHSKPFFKGAVTDERNVTYAEYFIDTDPGYGKGTAIPITSDGSVDSNFTVDLGKIKTGFHVVYTRVADESGIWSLTNRKPFFLDQISPSSNLVTVEYSIKNDNNTIVPSLFNSFDPSQTIDITFDADITGLSIRKEYTLSTTVVDEQGKRSLAYSHQFTVAGEGEEKSVNVISPNGGEQLTSGSMFEIIWSSNGIKTVTIEWSYDGGVGWNPVISDLDASNNSYLWEIPDLRSSDCLIRIVDAEDIGISDVSDGSFSVSPESYIRVMYPDGGEEIATGVSVTITWESNGVSNVLIEYSYAGGSNWLTIAPMINASVGSYQWTVADNPSTNCLVKVSDVDNLSINDASNGYFTITSKPTKPTITVISPNGDEEWSVGSVQNITWNSFDVSNINIEYSTDKGLTWNEIVSGIAASSSPYSWNVPDHASSECLVRIFDVSNHSVSDMSNNQFTIIKPELSIIHTPITEAPQNSSITFTTSVISGSTIEKVTVHYDKTGERIFDGTLELKFEGTEYKATLSSALFSAYGIEYYITATDIAGIEARFPEDGYISVCSQVSNMKSVVTVAGGSAQNAYRMISVPLNLPVSNIVDQLRDRLPQGNSGADWRLFRWSSNDEKYNEYPNTGEGFGPGKAFWIIIREGNFTLKSLNGTTVPTDKPIEITLLPGWNDIANPWLFSITWNDIENPTNANLSSLYLYEGFWSDPESIHTLEPWKGYAIRNNENIDVIIRLKPEPVKVLKVVTEDKNILWELSIKAYAGEAKDIGNHIGIRENAKIEWDQYDQVEPPVIGEYVSVLFPHRDWKLYPYDYTVDFRPPSPGNNSWDFNVKTNIRQGTVTVELVGTEQLPDGYFLTLLDLDSGHKVKINSNLFSFVSGKDVTERHFRLVITDSDESFSSNPKYFITAICYPNPFNPQTTIQYELPLPGKVTISVYNSIGQLVKTYDEGYLNQGVHELVFEVKQLTSGIYFYHVTTVYASVTGKMVYMK